MIGFDDYRAPALATDRLLLEPVNAWHGESLFPGLKEPMLYVYVPKEPPRWTSELSRRFELLETRRSPDGAQLWLNWAVRRKDNGYVGLVEATVERDGSAQIGYTIFMASQGQGYGAESVGGMLSHLTGIGVQRVTAFIDTRNAASIKLVERLGFGRVATHVMRERLRGRWVDDHEYLKLLGADDARD